MLLSEPRRSPHPPARRCASLRRPLPTVVGEGCGAGVLFVKQCGACRLGRSRWVFTSPPTLWGRGRRRVFEPAGEGDLHGSSASISTEDYFLPLLRFPNPSI